MPSTCGDRQDSWESLYSKEIKSVKPKGSQPWIFIGRTDAEAEALILWPPDVNSQFTGKDPDAGKDWGQEQKGATMNEMVGWYHQLTGYELSKVWEILKDRETWCYSPWSRRESDTTEWLNNNKGAQTVPEMTLFLGSMTVALGQDSTEHGWFIMLQ